MQPCNASQIRQLFALDADHTLYFMQLFLCLVIIASEHLLYYISFETRLPWYRAWSPDLEVGQDYAILNLSLLHQSLPEIHKKTNINYEQSEWKFETEFRSRQRNIGCRLKSRRLGAFLLFCADG
jgi:hypothetical protein